ncbi:methyl-accepting chemotaxis protein [Domibacillus sp. A3M-37]|uniref:methyl-accepting chemotaxis protein n=1 Tax=Domibacillus sp. A3M-37 TaxID=2962037 RepID=UPI0020B75584|nr:methyl-accepting chemotaxis protein [Domibacillus sp. A3M-37]MCP3762124.1 methyl-accepting chemotaxis protein [Domibacillus sp. A3M-37]
MKLVVKNTFMISLLIAISMMSISAFGYVKAKEFLYEKFQEQAYNQLESVKANINIWTEGKQETMEYIAEADALKVDDTTKAAALGTRLAERMENPDAFGFMDAEGFLYLGDAQIPVSDYEHFIGGRKGETNAYNPVPSSSPGVDEAPIVLASSPVYGDSGEIVGVASGGYPIETLINIISSVTLGESGYVTVFTNDGTIVAGQNKEDTLHKKIANYENEDLNQLVKESMNGKTGVVETNFNGEDNLIFYSKADEVDWGVMISVPVSEAFADANSLLNYFIIITIIFIVGSAIISYLLNNRSLKPITDINNKIAELANEEGDLTQRLRIKRKDEIGQLAGNVNALLDSLQVLIKGILQKGEVVSKSTSDLSESAEEIVQLSNDVTQNVQNAAALSTEQEKGNNKNLASITEITETVDEMKDHSSLVSEKTKYAYQEVETVNQEIQTLIEQMTSIQESIRHSADTVKKLGSRSSEIGNIVDLITGITEQTNLLALNASIEAARAGEHGRGFAVVAEEVRKLAEQSSLSAKQISELVGEILTETSNAVNGIETGTSQFGTGMETLKTVNGKLQNVYRSTAESSDEALNIFREMDNLLLNVKEVERVISDNSRKSAASSTYIREVASSSEEQLLSIQDITESIEKAAQFAEELKDLLNRFKI